MPEFFKKCSCGYFWRNCNEFLDDPEVVIIDYQINVVDFAKGYYLFNHIDDCRSTIALEVEKFFSIYDGPVYEKSLRGTPECTCFGKDSMNFAECCDRHCRDATARRIIQIIRERHAQALRGK
jgi:hypothetical protein